MSIIISRKILLISLLAFIACTGLLYAEPPGSALTPNNQSQAMMAAMPAPSLPFSYWIPMFLIIFGGLVIFVQYKYLSVVKPNPDVSLPSFSLTLIITGTLVMVSTGMNEKILGTAVGLFGTIAGYVLGRATHGSDRKETKKNINRDNSEIEDS